MMSNKLTNIAKEVLIIESDLWFRLSPDKWNNFVSPDDFELYMFEQTWGSTALGFGGMGGQAITTANTYVFVPVTCNQNAFVYFGSDFAYEAEYCDHLREDINNRCMKPCNKAGYYRKEVKE